MVKVDKKSTQLYSLSIIFTHPRFKLKKVLTFGVNFCTLRPNEFYLGLWDSK